jgi:hypothetical protein
VKIKMGARSVTARGIMSAAMDQSSFEAGNLTGHPGVTDIGWLDDTWRQRYQDDRPNIIYTVLSYYTPIAWLTRKRGWVVVAQSFSPTTAHHQAIVRGLRPQN